MLRRGALADYVGPVVAENADAARDLVLALLTQSTADKVFWDLLAGGSVAIPKELGFTPVRDLTRMWVGESQISASIELQYAIYDPATG
ncbi:MAG: hypothetical protein F9B45_33060 [Phycisphaera sp. RhM]|nr:hypothetical protein [Phycisphaera sp. RhM]